MTSTPHPTPPKKGKWLGPDLCRIGCRRVCRNSHSTGQRVVPSPFGKKRAEANVCCRTTCRRTPPLDTWTSGRQGAKLGGGVRTRPEPQGTCMRHTWVTRDVENRHPTGPGPPPPGAKGECAVPHQMRPDSAANGELVVAEILDTRCGRVGSFSAAGFFGVAAAFSAAAARSMRQRVWQGQLRAPWPPELRFEWGFFVGVLSVVWVCFRTAAGRHWQAASGRSPESKVCLGWPAPVRSIQHTFLGRQAFLLLSATLP